MAWSGGRVFGVVVAAPAVLAALGYFARSEYKSRERRGRVVSIVRDASASCKRQKPTDDEMERASRRTSRCRPYDPREMKPKPKRFPCPVRRAP
jgi:hypothetical protein